MEPRKPTPADEEIAKSMRAEIALHPGLTSAPGARAYLEGCREWLRFHAPRLARNLVSQMAREMVREAAKRVSRGAPVGDPPVVPDTVRALWEAPGGLPEGGSAS